MPKFNNDMLAHVWAQENTPSGETSNGNFSFDCKAIFSYHQVMGLFYTPKKRGSDRALFLNSDSYSVTTSKHSNYIRNATRHILNRVNVSGAFLDALHDHSRYDARDGSEIAESETRKECERLTGRAWGSLDTASRRRAAGDAFYDSREARAFANQAADLAKLFGIRFTIPKALRDCLALELPKNLSNAESAPIKKAWKQALQKRFAAERAAAKRAKIAAAKAQHARDVESERAETRGALNAVNASAGRKWHSGNRGRTRIYDADAHNRIPRGADLDLARAAMAESLAYDRVANMARLAPSIRKAIKARAVALESLWVPVAIKTQKLIARDQIQGALRRAYELRRGDYSNHRAYANGANYVNQLIVQLNRVRAVHVMDKIDLARAGNGGYRFAGPPVTVAIPESMRVKLESVIAGLVELRDAHEAWEKENQQALERESFEVWQRGESRHIPGSFREAPSGGVYMRKVDHNGAAVLETSRGASVPFEQAVKVFKIVKAMRRAGKTWQANGRVVRVGHFAVDSIDASGGFTAACHRFEWPEIEAIAIQTGVYNVESDDSFIAGAES
jgi:hypothetical protein